MSKEIAHFLINIMITLKIENLRKYYDNGIN